MKIKNTTTNFAKELISETQEGKGEEKQQQNQQQQNQQQQNQQVYKDQGEYMLKDILNQQQLSTGLF
jgi:hypothetical protein